MLFLQIKLCKLHCTIHICSELQTEYSLYQNFIYLLQQTARFHNKTIFSKDTCKPMIHSFHPSYKKIYEIKKNLNFFPCIWTYDGKIWTPHSSKYVLHAFRQQRQQHCPRPICQEQF